MCGSAVFLCVCLQHVVTDACLWLVHCLYLQEGISPDDLDMVFDGEDEQHTLGAYGIGLADALSNRHTMLRQLPPVTVFKGVKLSVSGGFQFDMNLFQTDTPILCDYLRMAQLVKQQYGVRPDQVTLVSA